jgi:hypothetical protein
MVLKGDGSVSATSGRIANEESMTLLISTKSKSAQTELKPEIATVSA